MKAISVCVNYDDLLRITLPRNKHHFEQYLIITSLEDIRTVQLCAEQNVQCYQTNAFYRHGAMFNKGLAMEEGFDILGRDGWITILDADIILPEVIDWSFLRKGYLFGPKRHLLDKPSQFSDDMDWNDCRIRRDWEFAGYCQIFHADDIKDKHPWYGVNWSHSGGCDSEFQNLWPNSHKIRPNWNVLHLGPTDTNWAGRCTDRLDGGHVRDQDTKRQQMQQIINSYRTPTLEFDREI